MTEKYSSDRIVKLRAYAIITRKNDLLKLAAPLAPAKTSGSFRDQYLKLPAGKAREDLVYQAAVAMGPPKLVKVTLPSSNGVSASYDVMPDYLTIDGLKVNINPITAEKIAHHFGLSLPTGLMSKQIYDASHIKILPTTMAPNQSSEQTDKFSKAYDAQVASAKSNDPNAIYGGGMKDLIVPEKDPNKVHATGWYTKEGTPIQGFRESDHELAYTDYSHGTRLTGNFTFVKNGKTIGPLTLQEIMTNPEYKEFIPFVSDKPGSYKTYASSKTVKKEKPETTPASATSQVANAPTDAAPGSSKSLNKIDQLLTTLEQGGLGKS
jgi:hypothetical protein